MANVTNLFNSRSSIGRRNGYPWFARGMGGIFQPGDRYRTACCQSPEDTGDMEKDVLVEKLAALNSRL